MNQSHENRGRIVDVWRLPARRNSGARQLISLTANQESPVTKSCNPRLRRFALVLPAAALLAVSYGCIAEDDSLLMEHDMAQLVTETPVQEQEDDWERPMHPKFDVVFDHEDWNRGRAEGEDSEEADDITVQGSTFKSSVGLGGSGYIRDLKFEKGDSATQTPLSGYVLIPADLNKGAGGTYIYLTFTRDSSKVQGPIDYCGSENPYVTGIIADDYGAFSNMKGTCNMGWSPYAAPPIWEYTGNYFSPWKHPDLNDGSGGRYIYAWQAKYQSGTPVREVGVVSGSSSGISCPSGWTRVNQDLNQGAGGDWIYFCYLK